MQPSGNTILITGGTSGIGRELALRFLASGNVVIVTGRRGPKLDAMGAAHPGLHAIELDVSNAEALARTLPQISARFPALNVLINNAGIMVAEDLAVSPHDLAISEATVTTNLLGPIRVTGHLMAHLRTQPRATIVNVTSGLAFVPLVATPAYNATKAALHSWTISLRQQLATTGIEVLELIPPSVQTDLMPGHASDPHAMPLADYIDEVMSLWSAQPTPQEINVKRLAWLRDAEREGRFDDVYRQLNGLA